MSELKIEKKNEIGKEARAPRYDAILRLLTGNISIKAFLNENEKTGVEKTLNEALSEVDISNVTTLASHLRCRRGTKDEKDGGDEEYLVNYKYTDFLVSTLGWRGSDENKYLLERICVQGKRLLGEPTQASIIAFAFI